jgi:hypothetical protein
MITPTDKSWYKSMGFRKNSFILNRLSERGRHTLADWKAFELIQKNQFELFKKDTY